MSDKDKSKPSKSVMGNLPSTRPTRMARRRDGEATAEAPARAKPKPKPKAAAKATPRPKAAPKAKAEATASKPRAVRSGSPSLDAAAKPRAKRREPAPPPKGTELVTTAVQATGELAKIGLTLGGQALKRAARRLPKP
ncbi:MAG TPA: hypothetical protein VFN44_24975 [Solirubrobacteraceae bacterium]|nr:hypothetical protein [Solirubrobacteraceae bacterium]